MSDDRTRIPTRFSRDRPIAVGDILGSTFLLEDLLGKGGMGLVFRARNVEDDTLYAVKVILSELAHDEQLIALLREEARALGAINHDAVVKYNGLQRDEHGRRYLVMEYAAGPSLASVLERRRLTAAEVAALRDRVAQGFAAAHDRGIYHRDISPDNIICPGERVEAAKIIDFGIAKAIDREKTIIGNDFAGKFSYVSPEQLL